MNSELLLFHAFYGSEPGDPRPSEYDQTLAAYEAELRENPLFTESEIQSRLRKRVEEMKKGKL
jgi:hypothetical protein